MISGVPAGHIRFQASLVIVVGKGLHSPEGERKIGPAIHALLRGALGFKLQPLEADVGAQDAQGAAGNSDEKKEGALGIAPAGGIARGVGRSRP